MSVHKAEIAWTSDGAFMQGPYSRAHLWRFDGGAEVRASASPSVVPMPMSDPAGVDPEEAFAAAVASCHMLWFLSLAQAAGLDVLHYADRAEAHMGRIAPGRVGITQVVLRPDILFGEPPQPGQVDALHQAAYEKCYIANSITARIRIEAPLEH